MTVVPKASPFVDCIWLIGHSEALQENAVSSLAESATENRKTQQQTCAIRLPALSQYIGAEPGENFGSLEGREAGRSLKGSSTRANLVGALATYTAQGLNTAGFPIFILRS